MTCTVRRRAVSILAVLWMLAVWSVQRGVADAQWTPVSSADNDAIRYSTTTPTDAVALLQRDIDSGLTTLQFDSRLGYLESLLRALKIPVSSQMLVYSKTSFQRERISPVHPRAVYLGSNVYVGWVPGAPLLELASIDSQLGAVFYTLRQDQAERPVLQRETTRCLQCHDSSSLTAGVPGLIMRSVHPDKDGEPILATGTFVTTDQSPLTERWGGWYVTGSSGAQSHMGVEPGNAVDSSRYLTRHSDIVALMVFGHQRHVQNLITRLNHRTRMALNFDRLRNADQGRDVDEPSRATLDIIRREAGPLLEAMLFTHEAALTGPIAGSSGFAGDFERQGPRDAAGRSLYDLDLEHRLFKYSCSYTIYSKAFDTLPAPAKAYVYRRLSEVLRGTDTLDILMETKPEFAVWHTHHLRGGD